MARWGAGARGLRLRATASRLGWLDWCDKVVAESRGWLSRFLGGICRHDGGSRWREDHGEVAEGDKRAAQGVVADCRRKSCN